MSKKNYTEAVKKEDKNYKTWLYKRIEGEVDGIVLSLSDDIEGHIKNGWVFNPGELNENPEFMVDASKEQDGSDMVTHPAFIEMAGEVAKQQTELLNLDHIDDKDQLIEIYFKSTGKKLSKTCKVETMRRKIQEAEAAK